MNIIHTRYMGYLKHLYVRLVKNLLEQLANLLKVNFYILSLIKKVNIYFQVIIMIM